MQKKTISIPAAGVLCAGSALAQSSVALYGIVDAGIRYTTNVDRDNGSLAQMMNGATTSSRWGMRGNENLGGDLSAVYQLEGGIEPDTGKANVGVRAFGRRWLAGEFGTVRGWGVSPQRVSIFSESKTR